MTVERKLRMGMVGGGPGAFIGPVHRIAAELDGKIELVAGAFSQSAERSREAGESYKIDPDRASASYGEMLEAERRRHDAIDFVAIVTPNHLHLPVAEAALKAGFPVMKMIASSPQKESRLNGIPRSMTNDPRYIGWRTIAYGPEVINC